MKIKPFLKWVGGKSRMIKEIDAIMKAQLESSNRQRLVYAEPFVGGGAVLFHVLSNYPSLFYAVICDSNPFLMNAYRAVKMNETYPILKQLLEEYQKKYNESDDQAGMYKEIKEKFNLYPFPSITDHKEIAELAAMLIFLNKTGFNGLYRVNKEGYYNVPWGKKKSVVLFEPENLENCHKMLHDKVAIMEGDYHVTGGLIEIEGVTGNEVVYYLDPPYRPVSKTSAFTSYTKECFNDDDQVELKEFCDRISHGGFHFIESNSKSDDFFDKLYSEYKIENVEARRNINSRGDKRGPVPEILIHN